MPTAKLNGIDIYYEEQGSGYPIVLTHGLGDSASLWTSLAEALADKYRLVSWDMRGHYRSEAQQDHCASTQDNSVEDQLAVCEKLEMEKAWFGGN